MNITNLLKSPRLVIEAPLKPIAGNRFYPTHFEGLGPAVYRLPDGTQHLIVDSAQAVTNLLEAVCVDLYTGKLVPELSGLPYVESHLPNDGKTNSLLEAHRLNSPYIVFSKEFDQIQKKINFEKNKPFNRKALVHALWHYDLNSLIHGVFLEKIGGVVRHGRALTATIEASNVTRVLSGGTKFDRVQAGTKEGNGYGKANDGFGNVPYSREEFCGDLTFRAILNLDDIRTLPLEKPEARELLVSLALWKVTKLLSRPICPRSGCDLEVSSTTVVRPENYVLPKLKELTEALEKSIKENRSSWGPSPFVVKFDPGANKAKKDAAKAAKNGANKTKQTEREGANLKTEELDELIATEAQ